MILILLKLLSRTFMAQDMVYLGEYSMCTREGCAFCDRQLKCSIDIILFSCVVQMYYMIIDF